MAFPPHRRCAYVGAVSEMYSMMWCVKGWLHFSDCLLLFACLLVISMTCLTLQSALLGFPYCNIFQCCPIDILHQDYNGMSKHLCEAVYLLIDNIFTKAVALSRKAEMNRRLSEMRNTFQARIPKQGLEAAALNAEVISCKVNLIQAPGTFRVL